MISCGENFSTRPQPLVWRRRRYQICPEKSFIVFYSSKILAFQIPDFCTLFDEFDNFRAKARLLHLWPGQPDHDCDQEEHLLRETERQVQRADNARPEVDSAEEHVRDVPHTRCHPIRHQVEELRLVLLEERPIANGFREEETFFRSGDFLLLLIVVIVKELATKQRPDRATRYEQILQEHDQVNWKSYDLFHKISQ